MLTQRIPILSGGGLNLMGASSLPSWLVHSRAGNGMMLDRSGLLVWGPNNQLTYSNTFTDASWGKTNANVTAAAAFLPDGTPATKLRASTTNNNPRLNASTAATGSRIVAQAVAKKLEANFLIIAFGSNPTNGAVWFNLNTGAVGTKQANAGVATIDPIGDGYYLCTVQVTGVNVAGQCGVWAAQTDGVTTWSGAVDDGILIAKASYSYVTYQTGPQPYFETNGAAYYGPRLEAFGLLDEASRTNLFTYSHDFNALGWTDTTITRVSTTRTSPDGVGNALEVSAASANATIIRAAAIGTSAQRSTGLWLRRVSGSGNIQFTTNNGGVWTTQAITSSWARFRFAPTTEDQRFGIRIVTSGDTIQMFGPQCVDGAVLSSYIPTYAGSSVTRAADVVNTSGAIGNRRAKLFYRLVSDETRGNKILNPLSTISAEADEWLERIVF